MENTNMTTTGSNRYDRFAHMSVPGTNVSPTVQLMPNRQYLLIKGRSCQENPLILYRRIQYALDKYSMLRKKNLFIYIKLEYFNTSSAKCIYNLLKRIQHISNRGVLTQVNWYYESIDEDMLELGIDFQNAFRMKFKLIPY